MKGATLALASLILCVTPLQSNALELVTNGDFEEATSTGWEESIAGLGATISRGTFYDIDMDYEAHLEKTSGSGHVPNLRTSG